MTVLLTSAQEERLQHLAEQLTLTTDELAQEVVDRFLDHQEDLLLAVKRGREDIAAGRVVDHEEVVTRIEGLLNCR